MHSRCPQTRQPRSRPFMTSRNRSSSPERHSHKTDVLTTSKYEAASQACRNALIQTAKDTSPVQLQLVLIALSCRAAYLQLMHYKELRSAVAAYISTKYPTDAAVNLRQIQRYGYLSSICRHVLVQDSAGFTHFKQYSMQYFITQNMIPYVQDGNAIIAHACLKRISDVDPTLIWKSNTAPSTKDNSASDAFLGYAFSYWQDHLRLVENVDSSILRDLHLCIAKAVLVGLPHGSNLDTQQYTRMTLDAGIQLAQNRNLSALGRRYAEIRSRYTAQTPSALETLSKLQSTSTPPESMDKVASFLSKLQLSQVEVIQSSLQRDFGVDLHSQTHSGVDQSWTIVSYPSSDIDDDDLTQGFSQREPLNNN